MKDIIYIGIDPSLTGTGIYSSDNKNLLIITKNEDNTITDRILYIWKTIFSFLKEFDLSNTPIVIGIEGFSYMSKGQRMGELFGLGYFIRCMLTEHKISYYDISPNTWKKFLLKQKLNKEGKDIIILETYKRYGKEIRNNNLCDAFNICKFIEALDKYKDKREINLTKLEVDLIEKCLKNGN